MEHHKNGMATRAKAVILCGKTEQIGAGVIELLKPEFEVIHFVMTSQSGATQISLLLQGKEAPMDSTLGTQNTNSPPVAIFMGAGYNDDDIELMRKACEGVDKKVPWLRPDITKPAPPLGSEYGKALVERIKNTMVKLQAEGRMNSGDIVWY